MGRRAWWSWFVLPISMLVYSMKVSVLRKTQRQWVETHTAQMAVFQTKTAVLLYESDVSRVGELGNRSCDTHFPLEKQHVRFPT